MGILPSQIAPDLVPDSAAETTIPNYVTRKLAAEKRPICVDLDGTLIKTDALVEEIVTIFSSRSGIARLGSLATSDRATLKRRVSEIAGCSPDLLPYNTELIAYLNKKRQDGHLLVLATAADARVRLAKITLLIHDTAVP
jgi:hypothetical protein